MGYHSFHQTDTKTRTSRARHTRLGSIPPASGGVLCIEIETSQSGIAVQRSAQRWKIIKRLLRLDEAVHQKSLPLSLSWRQSSNRGVMHSATRHDRARDAIWIMLLLRGDRLHNLVSEVRVFTVHPSGLLGVKVFSLATKHSGT